MCAETYMCKILVTKMIKFDDSTVENKTEQNLIKISRSFADSLTKDQMYRIPDIVIKCFDSHLSDKKLLASLHRAFSFRSWKNNKCSSGFFSWPRTFHYSYHIGVRNDS